MNTSMEQEAMRGEYEMISAAKTGCATSFTWLVDRYQGQVLRYLARHTGDHELAADLTQETLLDAYGRLERYHLDRPFAAWLFRIAHYNLLREWRRQRTRPQVSLDCTVEQIGDACSALHEPDQTVPAHERAVIRQTLTQLTPTLRQPLLLQSMYGFTTQEIADILGIAAPAARQRIARAKEQFRQHYQAINGPGWTYAQPGVA